MPEHAIPFTPTASSGAACDSEDKVAAVIRTFSQRLQTLLDNTGFPAIAAGRYSLLATRYGVSRQIAHRWCNAQAMPAPHILCRIAVDFATTLDWLFGIDPLTPSGNDVPVFKLQSPDIEAVQSNFALLGRMRFLPSSPVAARNYAIVQNWAESLSPALRQGDELLIDLSIQTIEDDGTYAIRTATSTSIRTASLLPDGKRIRFSRSTPLNTYASIYSIEEVFHNQQQQFDADWRQAGVLVLGRVEALTRSLLPEVSSFFSS